MNAAHWIDTLNLQPHPEGGFYREHYRSEARVATPRGERHASTGIYYLLRRGEFSRFHRLLLADEMWHFYAGDDLEVHVLPPDGPPVCHTLGPRAKRAFVVPAGAWFGACLPPDSHYCLAGCTVAPGFDFADFEIAERAALLADYPQHRDLIHRLTVPG